MTTVFAEISYDAGTHTYSGSGTWEEAITINDPTTFDFTDTENNAQFSSPITGNNTATKIGTGNWVISHAGTVFNSTVRIEAGTVTLNAQRDEKAFLGTVEVAAGATLVSGTKDAFGYTATTHPTKIYLNGGTFHKTAGDNETLGSVDLYFKAGTMSSTFGRFDILRSDVRFFAQALPGATAESPTVSTISAPLLLRNAIETEGFAIDVAENARLNITGTISADKYANDTYPKLVKTGTGLLTLANTGNAGIEIQTGTANMTGASSGNISVASGAIVNFSGTANAQVSVVEGGVFNLTSTGHSQLDILHGTVQVKRGGATRLMANNGTIHIRDGGLLALATHDSIGYSDDGSTTINIYEGGKMTNTVGNDSFRKMTFNLYGGSIDSQTGQYDILNSLNFNILPAEGATGTTVSTVNGRWNFRSDLVQADDILSLNIAENAELKFMGMFTGGGNGTIVKNGNGVLRLTNAGTTAPQPVTVEAGTLIAENNALARTSHLTITEDATFDPTSEATSLTGHYTLAGKQNIYFTENDFNPFEVGGSVHILDTAQFFLISDVPLDYHLFLEESFTIMEVTRTETTLERIPIFFDPEVFNMPELQLWGVWNDDGTALVTSGHLPEPSTWLLLTMSLGGLYWSRKKGGP